MMSRKKMIGFDSLNSFTKTKYNVPRKIAVRWVDENKYQVKAIFSEYLSVKVRKLMERNPEKMMA